MTPLSYFAFRCRVLCITITWLLIPKFGTSSVFLANFDSPASDDKFQQLFVKLKNSSESAKVWVVAIDSNISVAKHINVTAGLSAITVRDVPRMFPTPGAEHCSMSTNSGVLRRQTLKLFAFTSRSKSVISPASDVVLDSYNGASKSSIKPTAVNISTGYSHISVGLSGTETDSAFRGFRLATTGSQIFVGPKKNNLENSGTLELNQLQKFQNCQISTASILASGPSTNASIHTNSTSVMAHAGGPVELTIVPNLFSSLSHSDDSSDMLFISSGPDGDHNPKSDITSKNSGNFKPKHTPHRHVNVTLSTQTAIGTLKLLNVGTILASVENKNTSIEQSVVSSGYHKFLAKLSSSDNFLAIFVPPKVVIRLNSSTERLTLTSSHNMMVATAGNISVSINTVNDSIAVDVASNSYTLMRSINSSISLGSSSVKGSGIWTKIEATSSSMALKISPLNKVIQGNLANVDMVFRTAFSNYAARSKKTSLKIDTDLPYVNIRTVNGVILEIQEEAFPMDDFSSTQTELNVVSAVPATFPSEWNASLAPEHYLEGYEILSSESQQGRARLTDFFKTMTQFGSSGSDTGRGGKNGEYGNSGDNTDANGNGYGSGGEPDNRDGYNKGSKGNNEKGGYGNTGGGQEGNNDGYNTGGNIDNGGVKDGGYGNSGGNKGNIGKGYGTGGKTDIGGGYNEGSRGITEKGKTGGVQEGKGGGYGTDGTVSNGGSGSYSGTGMNNDNNYNNNKNDNNYSSGGESGKKVDLNSQNIGYGHKVTSTIRPKAAGSMGENTFVTSYGVNNFEGQSMGVDKNEPVEIHPTAYATTEAGYGSSVYYVTAQPAGGIQADGDSTDEDSKSSPSQNLTVTDGRSQLSIQGAKDKTEVDWLNQQNDFASSRNDWGDLFNWKKQQLQDQLQQEKLKEMAEMISTRLNFTSASDDESLWLNHQLVLAEQKEKLMSLDRETSENQQLDNEKNDIDDFPLTITSPIPADGSVVNGVDEFQGITTSTPSSILDFTHGRPSYNVDNDKSFNVENIKDKNEQAYLYEQRDFSTTRDDWADWFNFKRRQLREEEIKEIGEMTPLQVNISGSSDAETLWVNHKLLQADQTESQRSKPRIAQYLQFKTPVKKMISFKGAASERTTVAPVEATSKAAPNMNTFLLGFVPAAAPQGKVEPKTTKSTEPQPTKLTSENPEQPAKLPKSPAIPLAAMALFSDAVNTEESKWLKRQLNIGSSEKLAEAYKWSNAKSVHDLSQFLSSAFNISGPLTPEQVSWLSGLASKLGVREKQFIESIVRNTLNSNHTSGGNENVDTVRLNSPLVDPKLPMLPLNISKMSQNTSGTANLTESAGMATMRRLLSNRSHIAYFQDANSQRAKKIEQSLKPSTSSATGSNFSQTNRQNSFERQSNEEQSNDITAKLGNNLIRAESPNNQIKPVQLTDDQVYTLDKNTLNWQFDEHNTPDELAGSPSRDNTEAKPKEISADQQIKN